MTYVISDIHGDYDLFIKMLDEINFSDKDTLYILGDVIDRGRDSIKLLLYIMDKPNIILLRGNHEEMMLDFFNRNELPQNMTEVYNMYNYELWFRNGGMETIRELIRMKQSKNILNKLIEFLKGSLVVYIENIGTKTFYLVHADLEFDKNNKNPKTYQDRDFMIWNRKLPSDNDKLLDNTYLITGHMHQVNSEIFKHENWYCIGSETKGYGVLSCLRLDDFKEFYVKRGV